MSFSSQPFSICILCLLVIYNAIDVTCNRPPNFINDMNLALIKEDTAIGTAIYQLHGEDPEGQPLRYGLKGTDLLRVNDTTGIVSLAKAINYEKMQAISLNVTLEEVTEEPHLNNKVEVPVSLVILDVNDNSPKFAKDSYDVFLTEETPTNTTVLNIEVSDSDVVGTPLSVTCRSISQFNDACDYFLLDTARTSNKNYAGNLVLGKQLLFSEHPFLQFLLVCSDGLHETARPVTVFVSPTRVSPPEISSQLFAIINDSLPIGSFVMQIDAKVPKRVKGRLTYSLLSNPQRLFGINSQTGVIQTASVIDRETMSSPVVNLKIQVQVDEDGRQVTEYVPSSSIVDVQIVVRDVNDNPPRFSHEQSVIVCDENVENGFELKQLDLFVRDPDVNKSSLSIELVDESKRFDVEPKFAADGWAIIKIKLVNGPLDYENPNHRNFTLLVVAREEKTEERLSSTATVYVNVHDVNDNSPKFLSEQYTASVNESASPGTLIAKINAEDYDGEKFGSRSLRYDIRGLGVEQVTLNETTGELRVSESAEFDYETKRVYHFVYLATDTEGQGRVTVVQVTIQVLDADDNFPVFAKTRYTGVIRSGETEFSPPLKIQAHDKDTISKIRYKINDENGGKFFQIDAETGQLTSSGQRLDTDRFEITVVAVDGAGHMANATVSIDVERSSKDLPVFEKKVYNALVSEMAIPGTFVQQISAKFQTSVNYRILRGGREKFKIGVTSGVVTVAKGATFDFDQQKHYQIEIAAEADGVSPVTTTLQVTLEDVNNKPPTFTPIFQTAEIFENAKVGNVVHVLKAIDADALTTSSLKFYLSQKTANISPFTTKINNWFQVDENSGEITVAKLLNRKEESDVFLNVLVVDTSAPIPQTATGAVLISIMKINQLPPVFPPPWTVEVPNVSISIVEEQPIGSIVYAFIAIDGDSDIDGYALVSADDLFEVDRVSGVVLTKSRVDYETVQETKFSLVAFDTGAPQLSSTAVVTVTVINVNDNDPVFSRAQYEVNIKEHSAVNTEVVTVLATDGDLGDFGRVNYKLLGHHSNAFNIDTTGLVRVKDPALLDREKTTTITFYVMAEDHSTDNNQPRSASVPIIVNLLDINDHGPKFSQKEYFVSIMDNVLIFPPTPIVQLIAKDNDDGINGLVAYSIIDGNADGVFSINPTSGMLFPNVSLTGQSKRHVIKVIGRDINGTGPNYELITVTIDVLKVNSNAPRIITPSIKNSTIYVKENLVGDGHVVCTLFADDPDEGKNGLVRYFIQDNGNNVIETKMFSINSHSGQLRLNGPLDKEHQQKHNLILVAKDDGIPQPFTTLQQIIIVVEDVNDNEPQFSHSQFTSPYTFEIKENLQIGVLVGHVEAFDADSDDVSNIYYYIINGPENETTALAVDKLTGSIYTTQSFDYEKRREYRILIKATNHPTEPTIKNCQEEDAACVNVTVYIIDVNDNVPTFVDSPYIAGIFYDAPMGHVVMDVSAHDPDQEDVGNLIYTVEKTTLFSPGTRDSAKVLDQSPFGINSEGKVVTRGVVNVYKYDHFKLVIQCKEAAPSGKSASTTLEVWVYEDKQLTKLIVDKHMEDVQLSLKLITSELSNVTDGTAVVAEIKEKVSVDSSSNSEEFLRKVELGILVVDTKKRSIKPVRDVSTIVALNANRLQSNLQLSSISQNSQELSENQHGEEHEKLVLGAFVALCTVLFIGLVLIVITIRCMKRVLQHKINTVNLRREAFEPPITTENPLWIDQVSRAYEEQEIGLSVLPGPPDQMLALPGTVDTSGNGASTEAMYATIRRNARSARENLRTMEQNEIVSFASEVVVDPAEWHSHNSTLQRELYSQHHQNVCHVSPTFLSQSVNDIDDYCQSAIL